MMRGTGSSLFLLSTASAGKCIGRWRQMEARVSCLSPLIQDLGRPLLFLRPITTPPSSAVVVNRHSATERDPQTKSSPTRNNHPEHSEVTRLVDGLLARTRALMDQPVSSSAEEQEQNSTHLRHVVAFSGGIDSTLVLALLVEASKSSSMESTATRRESVHAVMGISPAVPRDQLALARRVTDHIGIPLVQVATTEGNDETYIANTGQACLACKTHLYSALGAVAEHAVVEDSRLGNNNHHQHPVAPWGEDDPSSHPILGYRHQLYNGTNADDVQDTTRVGLIAARNFHVQSPLLYTTKHNVRRAAHHLGLPNWNVAASPCLRSRLALGVAATQPHLQRIEAAESLVRQHLAGIVSETSNLRVRLLAGNRGMLEIDADLLPHVEAWLSSSSSPLNNNNNNNSMTTTATSWESHFVQTLGFSSFDARAFQSGSVARKDDSGQKTMVSTGAGRHNLQEAVA